MAQINEKFKQTFNLTDDDITKLGKSLTPRLMLNGKPWFYQLYSQNMADISVDILKDEQANLTQLRVCLASMVTNRTYAQKPASEILNLLNSADFDKDLEKAKMDLLTLLQDSKDFFNDPNIDDEVKEEMKDVPQAKTSEKFLLFRNANIRGRFAGGSVEVDKVGKFDNKEWSNEQKDVFDAFQNLGLNEVKPELEDVSRSSDNMPPLAAYERMVSNLKKDFEADTSTFASLIVKIYDSGFYAFCGTAKNLNGPERKVGDIKNMVTFIKGSGLTAAKQKWIFRRAKASGIGKEFSPQHIVKHLASIGNAGYSDSSVMQGPPMLQYLSLHQDSSLLPVWFEYGVKWCRKATSVRMALKKDSDFQYDLLNMNNSSLQNHSIDRSEMTRALLMVNDENEYSHGLYFCCLCMTTSDREKTAQMIYDAVYPSSEYYPTDAELAVFSEKSNLMKRHIEDKIKHDLLRSIHPEYENSRRSYLGPILASIPDTIDTSISEAIQMKRIKASLKTENTRIKLNMKQQKAKFKNQMLEAEREKEAKEFARRAKEAAAESSDS